MDEDRVSGEAVGHLAVYDNAHADLLYIDGFAGASVGSGVVKLNLYVDQPPIPTPQDSATISQRVVVARLVVPGPALVRIARTLSGLVDDMLEDGVISEDRPNPEAAERPAPKGEEE